MFLKNIAVNIDGVKALRKKRILFYDASVVMTNSLTSAAKPRLKASLVYRLSPEFHGIYFGYTGALHSNSIVP